MARAKNDYFTYEAGHRALQQVWNVKLIGFNVDVTIWVQGGENDGFARPTTFAKKHLMTFKGGKEDKASGKFRNKAKNILATRGTPFNANDPQRAKYGGQIDTDRIQNTLIFCDKFPATASDPDSLQQMFGQAMYTPVEKAGVDRMGHAFIEVVADQLYTAANRPDDHTGRHTEVTKWGVPDRLIQVHFGFFKTSPTNFQVFHLSNVVPT